MKSPKSKIWQTKFGPRRVKQALPTLEEALFAAKGLTEDFNEQVDIAADLMGAPRDEVRTAAMKVKHVTTMQVPASVSDRGAGATRSVVVERRVVRRAAPGRRIGVTGL
jgi:hypothetical protein